MDPDTLRGGGSVEICLSRHERLKRKDHPHYKDVRNASLGIGLNPFSCHCSLSIHSNNY